MSDSSLLWIANASVYAPQFLGTLNLLIAGGKIVWMGAGAGPLQADADIRRFDAHGARVIPGLIDIHAHLTGGGGEGGAHTRVPPVPLSRFTLAGITSVVGLLGTDDTTRSTGELIATVNGLRNEGLHAWAYTGGYHLPATTLTGDIRRDMAFVDCIVGVGELAICDHRSSQPTLNELLRTAADAHVGGLMTGKAGILHLHLGDGPRGLSLVREALAISELPARVFNPTHINRRRALFDEAIALAGTGCYVDITAFPVEEGEDAWAADEALLRYLASGAPPEQVTISSDGGGCLPRFNAQGEMVHMGIGDPAMVAQTLKALLQRDAPLEQVLPAFTSNPARLMRWPQKGNIRIGADADLVVLTEAGDVADVLLNGNWFVRDGLAQRRGTFELA